MTTKHTDQEYKGKTEAGKGSLMDKQVHGERRVISIKGSIHKMHRLYLV